MRSGDKAVVAKLMMLIGTLIVSLLITGCAADFYQVKRVKEEIPKATEFIIENDEFLSFLLEIMSRIKVFNSNIDEGIYPEGTVHIDDMTITTQNDEIFVLMYSVTHTSKTGYTGRGSIYDILTTDEETIILNRLREMILDGRPDIIRIYPDMVQMEFAMYKRAYLCIEHPSSNYEMYSGGYKLYSYKVVINDDWCVAVYKNANA